jgi:hypothetical protein
MGLGLRAKPRAVPLSASKFFSGLLDDPVMLINIRPTFLTPRLLRPGKLPTPSLNNKNSDFGDTQIE